MKEVEVNGQIFEFPDTMPDSEISNILSSQFPAQGSTPQQAGPQDRALLDRILGTVAQPSTGAMAGALAGAAAGTPAGPFGMLAGGAAGAFLGGGAGEAGRQLYAGEPANIPRMVGEASYEGLLDIGGAKAIDAIVSVGRVGRNLIRDGSIGNVITRLSRGTVDPKEEQLLSTMQNRLQEEYATTLRGSQIVPNDARIAAVESTAQNSLSRGSELDQVADRQVVYLNDRVDEVMTLLSGPNAPGREETGKIINTILDNARAASRIEFGQRFDELNNLGKNVKVSLQPLQKSAADAVKEDRARFLSSSARTAKQRLSYLADPRLESLRSDISKLPKEVDFNTAYDILKKVNRKIDEVYEPAKPNDPIIKDLIAVKNQIKLLMGQAAENSGDDILKKSYQSLMKDYTATQETLYSSTALSLLKNDAPEEAGRIIASSGYTTRPKEFQAILDEATRLGVRDASDNSFGGVKRGFLAQAFKRPTQAISDTTDPFVNIRSIREKLNNEEFVDTMKVLFNSKELGVLNQLLKEEEILSRSIGGELALSVRSQQLAAVRGSANIQRGVLERLHDVFTLVTPNVLATAISKPTIANQLLGNMAKARTQALAGKEVSAETFAKITGGLAALGIDAVGSASADQQNAELEALRNRVLAQ